MLVQQLPDLELALIDLRDSSVIAISDLSTYGAIPSSNQLALQITPPGYPTVNVPFSPLNVNVYKCVDLGVTCSDSGCTPLPDGIYEIVYTVVNVQPNAVISKKFIKIERGSNVYGISK